jgi:hypothetical protein
MALFSAILQPENTYILWYARIFRLRLAKNISHKFGWFRFKQRLITERALSFSGLKKGFTTCRQLLFR